MASKTIRFLPDSTNFQPPGLRLRIRERVERKPGIFLPMFDAAIPRYNLTGVVWSEELGKWLVEPALERVHPLAQQIPINQNWKTPEPPDDFTVTNEFLDESYRRLIGFGGLPK